MADEFTGVTSESPTESYDGAAPSAETLNTGTPAPQAEHSIPYSRFSEVNGNWRAEQARAQMLEQQLNELRQQGQQRDMQFRQLQDALRQRASQPSRSPEDEAQRQQALKALSELAAEHPELSKALKYSQVAGQHVQATVSLGQRLEAIEQQNRLAHARSEDARIDKMAKDDGLGNTPAELEAIRNLAAAFVGGNPQALALLKQGDPRVTDWAYAQAKAYTEQMRRQSTAALSQTKDQTRRLPPRIGGSTPGSPPPPTFDPKDPRGSMQKIHEAAERMLQSA